VTAGELALQRLANVPRGIAKTLMLAYGFTDDLIAGLERAGLATVVPDIATKTLNPKQVSALCDIGRSYGRHGAAARGRQCCIE
jgi:hypothetical protein